MLTSKNKTFAEIITPFIAANPDFKLSQEMNDFLIKIDTPCEIFSISDSCKLYELIFKIWSRQHSILLHPENSDKVQDLLPIHTEILYCISQEIENSKHIQDSTLLKDKWLSIWEYSLERLQLHSYHKICNDFNEKKYLKQSYFLKILPSGWDEWEEFVSQYLTIILMPLCVIFLIVYAIYFDK
ncbi:hypothetical protein [Anabaenopsis elenkinii]|uniref:Uncharacterized protein n=1 Tax=Anabaenopsis elenkinii CCIBt3563 TaxID=2779889 RepID=A0A7S6REU6_9CYAN|nr:hypothetical protein [Anabaenopsis elenkinii]QOV23603.1 hypothetical protein IM676_04705 [Anabaenopsis elenkinii CCIBt3563]